VGLPRSSIETTALDCLVFEKITFFVHILAKDGQTSGQTDKQLDCLKPLSLSIASGGLMGVVGAVAP